MNETSEPDAPETPSVEFSISETPPPEQSIRHWLRRMFACNPFYILSAALLLYGLSRISSDSRLLNKETEHLIFNFSSLQGYELLLVITAIFLARRSIWYDSMLLVGLENMLALVPFILISQASLIDKKWVWVMCAAGGVLAILRYSSLRRFMIGINLPGRMTVIGLVILTVNVALPVTYRILHESKFGTKPDWGAAYYTNEYVWWVALPILCALTNFVPFSRRSKACPGQDWLPIGCFGLWLAGTCVHLYCLGYVYDFTLRPDLLAPAIWMLLWIAYRRLTQFMPQAKVYAAQACLVLPALTTLLAASHYGHRVFFALTVLNVTIYQRIYSRNHGPRLALHLLLISLAALVAALPQHWGNSLVTHMSRAALIGASAAGYLLICAALSRDPKLGLFGGLIIAVAVGVHFDGHAGSLHWAAQTGIAFFLLHSLRWSDGEHAGARGVRIFICVAWLMHSLAWMQDDGFAWMPCAIVTVVLSTCLVSRLLNGTWGPHIVPLAAVLVALSGPGDSMFTQLQSAPAGVLALIGSFALFAMGTVVALTRNRWNKTA